MKGLLRNFLINLFTLWTTAHLVLGFKINGGIETYLFGSFILSLILIFIKPLLKILFLPINFLTLGLFSWVVNVAVLYLLTLFVPQIEVAPFQFPGFSHQGFTIPAFYLNSFESYLATSFVLSIISNFLTWLYH